MIVVTPDEYLVFNPAAVREAERRKPELFDMKLFYDAGRIGADEYARALKAEMDSWTSSTSR